MLVSAYDCHCEKRCGYIAVEKWRQYTLPITTSPKALQVCYITDRTPTPSSKGFPLLKVGLKIILIALVVSDISHFLY